MVMTDGAEFLKKGIDWPEDAWGYTRLPVNHAVYPKSDTRNAVWPIKDIEAPFNEVVEASRREGVKYAVLRRTGDYWLIVGYVDATGAVTIVKSASHISTTRRARRQQVAEKKREKRKQRRAARRKS